MQLSFITPDDPRYEAELDLRFRVLRAPLGHARADVPFPFERESLHLIAHEGARLLGCVLFYPDSAAGGRLFQMAVEPELQGRGLGRKLVRALEAELVGRGVREVYLHARAPVVPFYEDRTPNKRSRLPSRARSPRAGGLRRPNGGPYAEQTLSPPFGPAGRTWRAIAQTTELCHAAASLNCV